MEKQEEHSPAHPNEQRHAALIHLLVVFIGFALPYVYHQSKSKNAFIKHHGKQATLLNAFWLLMACSHLILAQMLHGLSTLQNWLFTEMGTPPDSSITSGIEITLFYNELTLWLEGVLTIALGCWMARKAFRGHYQYFFFAKPKQKKANKS